MTATLYEIETHWSLADLAQAHQALDLRDELSRRATEEAKRRADAQRNR